MKKSKTKKMEIWSLSQREGVLAKILMSTLTFLKYDQNYNTNINRIGIELNRR